MQGGILLGSRATTLQLIGVLLVAVIAVVHACGEHGHKRTLLWEEEIEYKGRRRTLLSMRGRR